MVEMDTLGRVDVYGHMLRKGTGVLEDAFKIYGLKCLRDVFVKSVFASKRWIVGMNKGNYNSFSISRHA